MPRKRVSMRKVREVLRLKFELGLSERQIAESVLFSKGAVNNCVRRARAAGIAWPPPEGLDDLELERRLYKRVAPPDSEVLTRVGKTEPDWEHVHHELKRKGVTLKLLWQEYRQQHPEGYGYSAFTVRYRVWKGGLGVTMRQTHKAGEKLFVDYAGLTLPLTDATTGIIRAAQVFVAVLGASSYTYTEVTETQGLEDWLSSHRRALEFFGGVPQIVVPDNLKVGVKSPSYYEPEINPAYAELAQHYGFAVIPTRVRKPRDKAKVEVGVQVVEQQVLAPLRDRTFFSLAEANGAVRELLDEMNRSPFQKLPGSRLEVFESVERAELHPLPPTPYVPSQWKRAKVSIDYHVEADGHYYSVPYRYARETVDLRLTANAVEVFLNNARIAAHRRVPDALPYKGRHTTVAEHMPKAHQRYGDWSPQRLIHWAQKTGEHTARVVEEILASKPHPEQGYRSCLGLMRLGKDYGPERLELACRRACFYRAFSYRSVRSILEKRLEGEPLPAEPELLPIPQPPHRNLRGAAYYRRNP